MLSLAAVALVGRFIENAGSTAKRLTDPSDEVFYLPTADPESVTQELQFLMVFAVEMAIGNTLGCDSAAVVTLGFHKELEEYLGQIQDRIQPYRDSVDHATDQDWVGSVANCFSFNCSGDIKPELLILGAGCFGSCFRAACEFFTENGLQV